MTEYTPPFEIADDFVPIQSFNPLFQHVAPPRQVMMGGNLAQANCIAGATRKRLRPGNTREHAKGTFKQMFDDDSIVLDVIPRFTQFDTNPFDLVIVEIPEHDILDCIKLPRHHVLHQHYGFFFKRDESVMERITSNARIPAGTVIATSPSVTEDGDYMPGAEVNVCNLDIAATAEDAMVFSETLAAKTFQTTGIESRIISCGTTHYPINACGTESRIQPIPNIGEKLRPNGLITALRPRNPMLDPVYMSKRKLLSTVYGMDEPIFGKPNATVIDIKVWHNPQSKSAMLPPEMTEQFRMYHEMEKEYYKRVVKAVMCRQSKLMSRDVRMSDRLWGVIVQAIPYLGADLVKAGMWNKADEARLTTPRLWRGQPMDEWRVELTFSYQTTPAIGTKATDLSGNIDSYQH